MMQTQTASTSPSFSDAARTRELATIHVARKKLALTEDSYRGLVSRFTRHRTESAGEMTAKERQDLIEYFRSIGFKRVKATTPGARKADYRPQAEKLKALWYALYELGVVRDRGQDALAAFVCRHTNIKLLRWNSPTHLNQAIECLKQWCLRVGWEPRAYKSAMPTPLQGSFSPGLIHAQWQILTKLGTPAPTLLMWMRGIGLNVPEIAMLTQDQAQEVTKALGRFIRAKSESPGDVVG